jgi:hypothetical protein
MDDINRQEDKFKKIIDQRDLIEVNIIRVAKQGKQSLRFIVKELLKKHGAEHMGEDVFSSLIELIFNAIKANYKYLFVREEIKKILQDEGVKNINEELNRIVKDEDELEKYINLIDMMEVQRKVRATLTGEESVTKIKDDAAKENRDLNDEEKKRISDALKTAKHAQKENIKVYLRISGDDRSLIIDVINTAPIFPSDLKRIREKRESFRQYKERGEEHNFYIENIDDTESAGFGAAMIDARLYALDIIPYKHYDIWGYKDKTAVTITFPLNKNE